MTGIGGDCFVMVKTPTAPPRALNGSGHAPTALTPAWLKQQGIRQLSPTSPLTVTVPGAVSAWATLHKNYGKLPWHSLFQVAIQYAQNGYPIYPRVAFDWQHFTDRLTHDSDTNALFNIAPTAGTWHQQKRLAHTLALIAQEGEQAFYQGTIADDIIAKLNQLGAPHTKADFSGYQAKWEKPLSANFRGWKIWECAPNGQGIIALLMLTLLGKQAAAPLTADGVATFLKIAQLAYTWRDQHVGDVQADWQGWLNALTHLKIDANKKATPPTPHTDTVYLTAVDANGLSVSFINSLFNPFGSGIIAPNSGVLLHNRGLGFSLEDGHPNQIDGGKRPMHTIIPAVAEHPSGDTLSFGVMGGHYQAAGQAWFLSRWLDDKLNLQEALDYPRVFNYPDATEAEPALAAELLTQWQASGQAVQVAQMPIGGGQAVLRLKDGTLIAASDSRKDGMAVTF